jgi:hypothetical protein
MARADIISKLYSKKTTALDFNYDQLMAPPLLSLIPQRDIEYMNKLVTSIKYNSKIQYKESEIKNVMECYGFKRFASGTHRVVYRHLDIPNIVAKISLNKTSLMDNIREYYNQAFIKPFCCKCFETYPTGVIGLFERVEPILSREEFLAVAEDIFDFINTKLEGKYVIDDIGTDSFMNYGMRIATHYNKYAFGPVLLDYPEVYPLDGNKLYCSKVDMQTGRICGAPLDHDGGFNTIRCTRCGAQYSARELRRLDETHEIIKKGVSQNMKLELRRGDVIVKEVDTNSTPTEYIEPPKKEKQHSADQMSIICNPRPRKYKYSSNNPTSRNTNKVEAVRVSTGLGLDTLSARSTGCVEDCDDTKVVAEAIRVPVKYVNGRPEAEEPVVIPSGLEMKVEVPEEVKEVVKAFTEPSAAASPLEVATAIDVEAAKAAEIENKVNDQMISIAQDLCNKSELDEDLTKRFIEELKKKIEYNEKFFPATVSIQDILAAKQDPEYARSLDASNASAIAEHLEDRQATKQDREESMIGDMAEAVRQAIKESEEDKEEMTTEVNNTEEQATSSFGTSMADILARMPKVEEEESSDDEDSDPEPDTDKMEQIIDEALKQIAEQREKVHLPIKPPETTDSEEPKTYDVDTGFIPSNDGTTEAPVDESDELGGAPTQVVVETHPNPFV